ncbi:Sugar lactone lactonase YvrE [Cohaesibacter sp. ES.047]|uniref:SMP-30/gluconolactonase/LRE family protein n=1 Tax=Cohaesibacter sp. ES.047 TaxID=1798205 RepID=UPI000BB75B1F|nr:SMP-30/gluconolactonase/LRE family protein [Cohaesibacter sp. ES.047]SNY92369.1 Sugar lactone lactonase YvrE [Cohaesibacter sp. ES.047]
MLQQTEAPFELLSQPMAITGKSPLWDEARCCVWWIDIQAQRLLATTQDGSSRVVPTPSQPGFVTFADSGRLVLGLEDGLWTYAPENGNWEQQSDTESDRPTVRLNDGRPDRLGRLWFGSMDMTLSGKAIGRLYRRDFDGSIHVVREGVQIPNAIVPCGSGQDLLFTDSPSGVLEMLEVDPATGAEISSRTIYRTNPGDTLDSACMDADGNFWVAVVGSGAVLHLSPSGRLLGRHQAPVSRPTAVTIGGKDGSSLFVTCQRRFLGPEALDEQPAAGGLLVKQLPVRAGPICRVSGF